MRRQFFKFVPWLAFICLAAVFPGCFSLGLGTTTYLQDKPETLERLESLESRLTHLERMLVPSAPSAGPVPMSSELPTPVEILVE